MSSVDINKFKQIQENYNEAVSTEREMRAELNMLKKQSIDILKEYGYTSFSDINKLKARIEEMEAEMKQTEEEMLDYIKFVNEKKAQKDSVLLG